jgi:hypothetical protein
MRTKSDAKVVAAACVREAPGVRILSGATRMPLPAQP